MLLGDGVRLFDQAQANLELELAGDRVPSRDPSEVPRREVSKRVEALPAPRDDVAVVMP